MKAKKKRRSEEKKPKKRRSVEKKPAADVRRVDTALRKFDKAQQVATDRGTDLLAVAEALGDAAVEKRL